jgi:hypothetical protein
MFPCLSFARVAASALMRALAQFDLAAFTHAKEANGALIVPPRNRQSAP